MRTLTLGLTLFCCLAVPSRALDLTWTSSSIDVMTETGASVALIGVTRIPVGFSTVVATVAQQLDDENADGFVSFDGPESAGSQAIWVAIDLASGAHAWEGPPDSTATEVPFNPGVAFVGSPIVSLLMEGGTVHLAIVRPGIGGWSATVTDGGPLDTGPPGDAAVLFELPSADPMDAGLPTLSTLLAGDRVVTIDADTLTFSVHTVE